jgi:transposase
MAQAHYNPWEYDTFIGIDVDKGSFSFTVRDHGMMKRQRKIPSKPDDFYHYIQKTLDGRKVVCAYEAGPTGFHLYDHLNQLEIPCYITSPASIPKPPNSKVKTNRLDSGKIVEYLMSGEFKPIRVPEGPYRELRHLVKVRERYGYERKATKQRIKSLLLYTNLHTALQDVEANWSNSYIQELGRLECSFAVRHRLDLLLQDLTYARNQTALIHRTIRSFCREHRELNEYMKYLQSIPGIGFIVASTVLGRIGDPSLLRNQREIGAFLGLTPRERSTGDTVYKGSITHWGNKVLRSLLVEAAWVAIRKDTQLRQFYYRLRGRHHSEIASKVAITAVARKLTLIIYRVLTDRRPYIRL